MNAGKEPKDRSLLGLFEYYAMPRLPENAIKGMMRAAIWNYTKKHDPVYDGIRLSYRPGLIYVNFHGTMVKFIGDSFLRIELEPLNGYLQKYLPKKGDVIIDCGAYNGVFSIIVATIIGPKGRVYAFEPDEESFSRLKANCELNGIANVIAIKKGLWSTDGKFRFQNCGSGCSHLALDGEDASTLTFSEIEVTTLDNEVIAQNIEKISFIKMDIEGAEIEALKGAETVLKECTEQLAIATYHILNGQQTFAPVEELLTKLGFSVETNYPIHLTTIASKALG